MSHLEDGFFPLSAGIEGKERQDHREPNEHGLLRQDKSNGSSH